MFTASGLQLTLPQTITGAFQNDQSLSGTTYMSSYCLQ